MVLLDTNRNPSPRELRWFGLMFLAFWAVVGGLVAWRLEAPRTGGVLAGVGGLGAAVYYALPPLREPLYRGWLLLTFPLGWLGGHAVLFLIYFAIVTPLGLLARLVGRDRLGRRIDPSASTYWVECEKPAGLSSYFRQY